MAKDMFTPHFAGDTRELRKEIGLPITKELQYVEGYSEYSNSVTVHKVISYEIVDTYMPSGTHSLLVTLANGEKVRILGDYFAEMQNYNEDDIVYEILGKRVDIFPENYVVYDIETTGLSNKTEKIIEISAIKCRRGKIVDEFSTLVSIDKLLPKKITKLTGITDEMLNMFGVSIENAVKDFNLFIDGEILVGHNIASFDNHFIAKAFAKHKLPFKNDFVDTLYLAQKTKKFDKCSLESLSEAFAISYEGAHRAIVDCKINNEVYLRLSSLLGHEIAPVDTEIHEKEIIDEAFDTVADKLSKLCEDLVAELKLPIKGLFVNPNKNEKVKSVSICINEPPYPMFKSDVGRVFTATSILLINRATTKRDADKINVFVKLADFENVDIPRNATILPKTKDDELDHYIVQFNEKDEMLFDYASKLIKRDVKNYSTKEKSFGCCSQMIACSDARECVHANRLYSTACMYRHHLENGEIFYGVNKNV